jgi:hypothetical protein
VAIRALMRRRLVEQDGLVLNVPDQLVAVPAGNLLVGRLEREIRPSLVIEQGRPPARGVVAIGARGVHPVSGKLPGVRILVAAITLLGRGAEHHVLHRDFQVRRFVATRTSHSRMGPGDGKRGSGMVEADILPPRAHGMTGFTPQRFAICLSYLHARGEFAPMGIRMAGRTGQIIKVVRDWRGAARDDNHFVALRTRDSDVPSRQGEFRSIVPR